MTHSTVRRLSAVVVVDFPGFQLVFLDSSFTAFYFGTFRWVWVDSAFQADRLLSPRHRQIGYCVCRHRHHELLLCNILCIMQHATPCNILLLLFMMSIFCTVKLGVLSVVSCLCLAVITSTTACMHVCQETRDLIPFYI